MAVPTALQCYMENSGQVRLGATRKFIVDDFDEKVIFLCQFCGGKECHHENYLANKKLPNAIQGLNSNWITDNILAMQRPSQRLIKEFNLYAKFKEKNIRAVLNLQEPGEHPYCGDGIIPNVGFSYVPEHFYQHGIHCFSECWQDMTSTTFQHMMRIMNIFDMTLKDGGRISVHCHAGRGRTLLVICSWLIYNDRIAVDDVIKLAQQKREGVLASRNQHIFLRYFEKQLHQRWISFHIGLEHRSFSSFVDWQSVALLKREKKRLNCTSVAHYRIMRQLRKIAQKDPMSVLQAFLTPNSIYFKSKWDTPSQQKIQKLKKEMNSLIFKNLKEQKDPRILTELLFDYYDQLPFTLLTAISIDCLKEAEKDSPNSKHKIFLTPSIIHNFGVESIATILDILHFFKQLLRTKDHKEQSSSKAEGDNHLEREQQLVNQNLQWALFMRLSLFLLSKRKYFVQIFPGEHFRDCKIYKFGTKTLKIVGTQTPYLLNFLREVSRELPDEHSELQSIVFKARKVQSNLYYHLKEGKHQHSLSLETKTHIYQSAKISK